MAQFLGRYEKENSENFQVRCYTDGIHFVEEYVSQFDIILMDIRMKFMDGMSAAKKIREKDKQVIIIFITNMAEYAIQGYDVAARGFVLKPVTYRAFSFQIDRACQEINKREDTVLSLLLPGGGIRNIVLKDLYFVESEGHYLNLQLTEERITFYSTVKEFEKRLDPKRFCRCNSGVIVNLQHVQKVENSMVYVMGVALPVSRSRKKGFMEALTDYIGENHYV